MPLLYDRSLVDLWKLLPCKLNMVSLFVVDNIASLVLFHRYCFLEPQYLLTAIFTLEFNLKDKLPVDVDDFRNVYFSPSTFRKEK